LRGLSTAFSFALVKVWHHAFSLPPV